MIASFEQPFSHHGGTKVLSGNLGRAVMKTSAVPVENQVIEAPAVVFESQHDVMPAFEAGLLDRDCVVVVRHQGPKRTECQNYINSCRHLVYYWTGVSKLR